MDFSAPHVGYVIACYGLSTVVIGGLIVATLWRDRRLRAEASALDAAWREPRT